MKENFILYMEQKEIFDKLSHQKAGQLIKAIFEYQETDTTPKLDNLLKFIFIPIKNRLDVNNEKYNKTVERNRINGVKGGRPKNPNNPSGYFENPSEPKKADTDTDIDDDDIYKYYNMLGLDFSNIEILSKEAQKELNLYQEVVKDLYINKNIEILNNLKIEKLSNIYEKMKDKDIDNEVQYLKTALINQIKRGN